MPSPRRRSVRALLLIAALLAAFGATTALAASSPVKVQDNFFSAKTISVSRGSTVTWKWAGSLYHNVKVRSGPAAFGSRTQVHGSFAHRFTARGTYRLYCSVHQGMKMTVVVR